MGSYTELFGENFAPLAKFSGAAVSTEQNSGYVAVGRYHRIAIVLHAPLIGTSLDLDVEITTDGVSAGLFTLKSMTQLDGNDDGAIVVVEVRTDELGKPTGASSQDYDYLNVEITPSGNATFSCVVYGFVPRVGPVDATLWDEIVT